MTAARAGSVCRDFRRIASLDYKRGAQGAPVEHGEI
jgi:hypothetical protein